MEKHCARDVKRYAGRRRLRHWQRLDWRGLCVAALGLLMIGYGVFRGEAEVVLAKAVNICLECIGIG